MIAPAGLVALALALSGAAGGTFQARASRPGSGGAGGISAPSSSGSATPPTPTGTAGTTGGAGSRSEGSSPGSVAGTAKKTPAPRIPSITAAQCVPVSHCSANPSQVSVRGTLRLTGRGLKAGMTVLFPHSPYARISPSSPAAHLHNSKLGLVVTVPSKAHSGRIEIMLAGGRHSGAFGPIQVVAHALHPPPAPPTTSASTATGTAFSGQGMWIWYVSKSSGGSVAAIIAQAHAAGVSTIFIKSSDGSENYWSQFNNQLVTQLHENGLKVCAWQYVYGSEPVGEARLGAEAVAAGADCLVIDAETEYEGHYGAAQTYIQTLRAAIGPSYPVGLASFPYVDYHPQEPYSVFMGPGGAQFNLPQMYWKDIGTSVEAVYSHTFQENLIYQRPILPLGQTFETPSPAELVAFRSLAGVYGASGLSFWDWQETSPTGWGSLVEALSPTLTLPSPELTSPLLKQGGTGSQSTGDQVLWMQEHLATAVPTQATTGIFDTQTTINLEQFQTTHGLPATGETDPSTWAALLALAPVPVDWTSAAPHS